MATTPYDGSVYLDSEEMISAYLAEAFEDGDPQGITAAIGNVAKAKSMADLAKAVNVSRESLYKSLSPTGNPSFSTIMKVMHALGVQLTVQPRTKTEDVA